MSVNDKDSGKTLATRASPVLFLLAALIVVGYCIRHAGKNVRPDDIWMKLVWGQFYLAALWVLINGLRKSVSTEIVVYALSILAEAILPEFCADLVSKLDSKTSVVVLEITCHLMLTLMSCGLLLGWVSVLGYHYMARGGIPVFIRLYLFFAVVSAVTPIVWAIKDTAGFIGLDAVQQHEYINGVWPAMYACSMSYVRIVLTVVTLFVPWVRFRYQVDDDIDIAKT